MKRAIIIGGGIIGLSSAYYLRKEGWEVTVIDRHEGKDGASYGNAGYIGPSHYTPLASPKAFKNALKWMLSPTSPFYVHPTLSLSLFDWGTKFMASATPQHVRDSAQPLIDISLLSLRLFDEWHAEFPSFSYEKKGLIEVYQTEAALRSSVTHVQDACERGLQIEPLTKADIARLEPGVEFDVAGGVHFHTDAHTYPPKLMATLIDQLRAMGVQIVQGEATSFTRNADGRILEVQTKERPYEAELFVLAAGAWSRELGLSAGMSLPMVSGRGYSITFPHKVCPLRHPIYLVEGSVAVTPMNGDKVRIGGTMEIVPKGTPPRMARVQGILTTARRFMPAQQIPEVTLDDVWWGYRPCSADGMPYIGRLPQSPNLIAATGHAMLGLSLGPATGKLVAEIAEGRPASVNLAPFSPTRFQPFYSR